MRSVNWSVCKPTFVLKRFWHLEHRAHVNPKLNLAENTWTRSSCRTVVSYNTTIMPLYTSEQVSAAGECHILQTDDKERHWVDWLRLCVLPFLLLHARCLGPKATYSCPWTQNVLGHFRQIQPVRQHRRGRVALLPGVRAGVTDFLRDEGRTRQRTQCQDDGHGRRQQKRR